MRITLIIKCHRPLFLDIPLKRFAEPAKVPSLVVFLASDESAYITGSDLLFDGDRSLY